MILTYIYAVIDVIIELKLHKLLWNFIKKKNMSEIYEEKKVVSFTNGYTLMNQSTNSTR